MALIVADETDKISLQWLFDTPYNYSYYCKEKTDFLSLLIFKYTELRVEFNGFKFW